MKKNIFLRAVVITGVMCGAVNSAMAGVITENIGSLNLSGTVIGSTCDVSMGASSVDLNAASLDGFSGVGAVSNKVPVNINFTNCDPALKGVTISFNGASDTANPQAFANTSSGDGAATGIAAQLVRADGAIIPPGGASEKYNLSDAHSANAAFFASMVQTYEHPTAGSFSSGVELSALYN